MALVALIAAAEPLDALGGSGLRALATIGGETVIERQAARVADAGAERILVAVASVPAELAQAIDRIRRRGVSVQAVRNAPDLLAAVQTADRLMLVADGLIANAGHYQAIAAGGASALLVTADTPSTQGLERIDAGARWAGLASVSGDMVAELAALPGEWDMVLTLLRFAVQSGAPRLMCEPALFDTGEIAIVTDKATATTLETAGIQQVEYGGMGMGRSLFSMPLVRLAGLALVASPRAVRCLPWATALAWLAVVGLAGAGLGAAAAVAAIVASLGLTAMRFAAAFRVEDRGLQRVRNALRGVSLVLLGLFPWILAWGAQRAAAPPFSHAALSLCLAGAILLARWLFAELAEGRRFHWLLPDADQAWLLLAPALAFGVEPLAYAFLPLAALFQILVWMRLARRRSDATIDRARV